MNLSPTIRRYAVSMGALTLLAPSTLVHSQQTNLFDREQLLKKCLALEQKARSSPDGLATEILERHPTSYSMLIVRVKSGLVEQHADWADVMIPLEGEANVITGGDIVDGKPTAAGELRGASSRNGETQHIAPGIMLRVAAGVPHQMQLKQGMVMRYFVIKLTEPAQQK